MSYLKTTISTELKGATSVGILTLAATDTIVTLDVLADGAHINSRMTLEHSPDGVNWFASGQTTNGNGTISIPLATAFARACVARGEGTAQTATIFLTAK